MSNNQNVENLRSLREVLVQLREELGSHRDIREDLGSLRDTVNGMQDDLKGLKHTVNEWVGKTNERFVRDSLAKKEGDKFSSPYTIHGLMGLARLVMEKKDHYVNSENRIQNTDALNLVSSAEILAQQILHHRGLPGALNELFRSFELTSRVGKMITPSEKSKKIGEFFQLSRESVENLKICLQSLNEMTMTEEEKQRLTILISHLLTFAKVSDDDERIRFLITEDGFGLMLFSILLAQAHLNRGNRKEWLRSMRNTIEMDIQGRRFVFDNIMSITVGEITTRTSSFGCAESQLDLRASLVEAAVRILYQDLDDILVQKHIFIPADSDDEQSSVSTDYKIFAV
jgi:hypothetical protein